jgi:hypothetical protein
MRGSENPAPHPRENASGIRCVRRSLTQQMVASYEVGRRRVPVSLLPAIASALAVSVETLIGQKDAAPGKRGPAPKLQQQMERIQRLPRAKQRFVMDMIDTVLAQQDR